MLTSTRSISGFMPNLRKNSCMISNAYTLFSSDIAHSKLSELSKYKVSKAYIEQNADSLPLATMRCAYVECCRLMVVSFKTTSDSSIISKSL